ncbi:hypothetical protein Tco_0796499 [Tanacetum coccineum]
MHPRTDYSQSPNDKKQWSLVWFDFYKNSVVHLDDKKRLFKLYQCFLNTAQDRDVGLGRKRFMKLRKNGVLLYLIRKSLEVLRKFHWTILGGRFNQLSHVSSPLLSKPGEY